MNTKHNAPIRGRTLLLLTILASTVIYFISIRRNVTHFKAQRFDDDTVDIWLQHLESYELKATDRYVFREMGFRTRFYAESLESQLSTDILRMDNSVWSFIPQIHQLRSQIGLSHQARPLVNVFAEKLSRRPNRRGIVTSTDAARLRGTVQMISTLRTLHNCTLPIEIFYGGKEEMPDLWGKVLASLPSVTIRDIEELPYFDDDFLGYSDLKMKTISAEQAIAMLSSSFHEIIFIEPGTVFFTNPDELFKDKNYQKTGTLFFSGSSKTQMADSQRFVNYLRQQYDQGHPSVQIQSSGFLDHAYDKQQDPSVVVLNRARPSVFSALLFNLWMHSAEVRNNIWHVHFAESLSETLWLAFEMAQLPFHFVYGRPGAIGNFDGSFEDLPWDPLICPAHVLHTIGQTRLRPNSGRPVWMSGGLNLWPGHPMYLPVNAWSPIGRWVDTEKGACMQSANPRMAREYSLDTIALAAQQVDEAFEEILRPLFSA